MGLHSLLPYTDLVTLPAKLIAPRVARVVISNPMKTRAIAEAKVKTDKSAWTSAHPGDGGHGNLPIGGHRDSPLTATGSSHGWPSDLPTTTVLS